VVGELADHPRVAVEVVVVVVAHDAAGLDAVVDGQGVCEHVVPPELPLDDAVEAGVALPADGVGARAVVGVRDGGWLVAGYQVALLVALEVRELLLRAVRQRIQPWRRGYEFGHRRHRRYCRP